MPQFPQSFARAGNPADLNSLAATIRPTVGDPFYVYQQKDGGAIRVIVTKETAWQAGDITTVQSAVTAAVDATPQTEAQATVDQMSIFQKAIVLALLDEINILRAALSLTARTPAQAIAAVRNKAGTL